jgi:energy-coupling factor transporter ATP-binding protein EcfA2
LRPFDKDEWAIFFGRERMIDEVVDRLIRSQLLVIHGDSGCGKSSLVRAGVLARLEQESARGGLTWRTCATQPRDAPLLVLAESLARLDGRAGDEQRILEIRRVLNYGADAPAVLAKLLRRGDSDLICILLDQFEELFAFAKRRGPDEATLFVQLLVGMLEHPPAGLYVVVTMRSEFLGTCAQFPGLAEAVNRLQYLVPRMARTDILRAVRDPAALYGGRVSLELAERLILDAGRRQDELPLIQHGLAVLYRRRAAENQDGWRLDLADYASTGGVAALLSTHADILWGETSDESTVERLFRALTDINAEGQAIRRPQTFGNLASAAGVTVERLETVTRIFRREGASFLTPYGEDPIGPDELIDISHEALIRCWTRLSDPKDGWLSREFEDGLIWRSLLIQADSFERDSSNILSPATARERSAWLESRNEAAGTAWPNWCAPASKRWKRRKKRSASEERRGL